MSIYTNHFLTNVILRIDFASEESQLKTEINSDVRNSCIKHFPIPEDKKIEIREFVVNNKDDMKSTQINQQSIFEWHFWGKNREKELCVTSSSIFIDHRAYTSFSDLKTEFCEILSQLIISYSKIKFNRIGLRYVDKISLLGDKTQRKDWSSYWKKYLDASLVQGLNFADSDASIARQMNSIEMNYGDHMLRFQYGIHNEDYPAPNKKQIFILDTDVYSVGLFAIDEVDARLEIFHNKAKDWFERSIKDTLRRKMGVIE